MTQVFSSFGQLFIDPYAKHKPSWVQRRYRHPYRAPPR